MSEFVGMNGRRLVLIIEHDNMEDGDLLSDITIPILRKYVEMVEKDLAGNRGFEIFNAPNGGKLTAIGTIFGGNEIPCELSR